MSARKQNIYYAVVIAIILFLIISPTLCTIFHIVPTSPLNENRYRVQRPEGNMMAMLWNDPNYSQAVNSYFNDNYALRDLLIKTKNQLDFSIFRVNDGLYFGLEGFLFYKNVINNEQIQNERMTKEEFQSLCNKFVEVKKILEEKGIALFVIVNPQKNSVYPELLPDCPVKRPEITTYDRLQTFLDTNEEMKGSSFSVKDLSRAIYPTRPAFYKADFHWNYFAAAHAGKRLVEAINQKMGMNVPWSYDIVPQDNPNFSGTQNLELATFFPVYETEYSVAQNWEPTLQQIPAKEGDPFAHYASSREPEALLPPVLFIGNSYAGYFPYVGLLEHFSESYILHETNAAVLPKPENVKIVVIQLIESELFRYEKDVLEPLTWQ